MEERLDDAIHVLRNHAEGQMPGMPPHMIQSSHSNGILAGSMGYGGVLPSGPMDSHMVSGIKVLKIGTPYTWTITVSVQK